MTLGSGIRAAIIPPDPPPARLLDLTRSLRRAGRLGTGVDRVERAYLRQLLTDDLPLYALLRSAFGYFLLDRSGLSALASCIDGHVPWDRADLMSRLPGRRHKTLQRAETTARRLALARAAPPRLARMLKRHLPPGFAYFNVGHSNLTERVLSSISDAQGGISVLIHDVIPLEHPEFQRIGTVEPFRDKLQLVGHHADRVIYNSQDTRARSEARLAEWGNVPTGCVAHLGLDLPQPTASDLPEGLQPEEPFFLMIGTIEPRKNHAFLLDLWETWGEQAPLLLICGKRGWNNSEVFARLDALGSGARIREVPDLSDAALAQLLQRTSGLLFPSLAEGFGLPPVEAAALGARVLCNNLPVLREVLGDYAVYAAVTDSYLWKQTIENWAVEPPDAPMASGYIAPTWASHFETVLRFT